MLVNTDDEVIGNLPKRDCHLNSGILHRAFSIFIFNGKGEVLLQKRSAKKMLWPDYWSNSCCSHPRWGEAEEVAVQRRLEQELGLHSPLQFLYKFIYRAQYKTVGVEHEMCSVWIGHGEAEHIVADPDEIACWQFVGRHDLTDRILRDPERYTPWMKLEWQRLNQDYQSMIVATQ